MHFYSKSLMILCISLCSVSCIWHNPTDIEQLNNKQRSQLLIEPFTVLGQAALAHNDNKQFTEYSPNTIFPQIYDQNIALYLQLERRFYSTKMYLKFLNQATEVQRENYLKITLNQIHECIVSGHVSSKSYANFEVDFHLGYNVQMLEGTNNTYSMGVVCQGALVSLALFNKTQEEKKTIVDFYDKHSSYKYESDSRRDLVDDYNLDLYTNKKQFDGNANNSWNLSPKKNDLTFIMGYSYFSPIKPTTAEKNLFDKFKSTQEYKSLTLEEKYALQTFDASLVINYIMQPYLRYLDEISQKAHKLSEFDTLDFTEDNSFIFQKDK